MESPYTVLGESIAQLMRETNHRNNAQLATEETARHPTFEQVLRGQEALQQTIRANHNQTQAQIQANHNQTQAQIQANHNQTQAQIQALQLNVQAVEI
jgi:hypothetical protein